MTEVTAQMSISLDGCYAGPMDPDVIEETFAAGACVMGRRMFDGGEIPWGDIPPFRAPVFVVTHRPRATLQREGGTSFTFVTGGIERAVALAREAAGGKDVAVAGGGTLLRQVIGAGLFEQLELHIAPVVPDRRGDFHVLPRLLGDGTCCATSRMGPCASSRTWVGDDPNAATKLRFRTTYEP